MRFYIVAVTYMVQNTRIFGDYDNSIFDKKNIELIYIIQIKNSKRSIRSKDQTDQNRLSVGSIYMPLRPNIKYIDLCD